MNEMLASLITMAWLICCFGTIIFISKLLDKRELKKEVEGK